LNLPEVPIILREADDRAVLELALIENLQRENLNPIEEAQGYSQLIGQFQLTQEDVATKVGKSRAGCGECVCACSSFHKRCKVIFVMGGCPSGTPRSCSVSATEKQQQQAAERVIQGRLECPADLRGWLRNCRSAQPARRKPATITPLTKDAHVADLENRIREKLGTKVQLRYSQGKGNLEYPSSTTTSWKRILQILGITQD